MINLTKLIDHREGKVILTASLVFHLYMIVFVVVVSALSFTTERCNLNICLEIRRPQLAALLSTKIGSRGRIEFTIWGIKKVLSNRKRGNLASLALFNYNNKKKTQFCLM